MTVELTIYFCLMLLLCGALKLFKFDMAHPVMLYSIYWISFIVISILCSVVLHYDFNPSGIKPILLSLWFSVLGGIFLISKKARSVSHCNIIERKNIEVSYNALLACIVLFSLLGLIAILIQLKFMGFNVSSFGDILIMSQTISNIRYNEGMQLPKTFFVLLSFLYSAAFISGFVYHGVKRNWHYIVVFVPIIIALANAVINSARAGFFITVVIWFSAFLASLPYYGKSKQTKKILKMFSFIILFTVITSFVIQVFRIGRTDVDVVALAEHLSIFFFGSFNAFTLWYGDFNQENLSLGLFTFAGIFDIFGYNKSQGLFSMPIYISEYRQSNVYTVFRPLIEDFSIIGLAVLSLVLGAVSSLAYVFSHRGKIFGVYFSALLLSVIGWSFVTNMLIYNSVILGWIITFITIVLISLKRN